VNQRFFRFPQTPHLDWFGAGSPREDKVLTKSEVAALLAGPVVVEEKVDGANLGLSLNPSRQILAQNRGQYVLPPFAGQFSRLAGWLAQHQFALADQLSRDWILFGEWCAAKHSLEYTDLPDWFVLFDVYDRIEDRFWSTRRRNVLADSLGLAVSPEILRGRTTLPDLRKRLESETSRYRAGPLEGLVIRRESADWCEARAKLVRKEFTQAIGEHWRSRRIQWNQLRVGVETQS
jgi:ATP-dependent RNA circularization protein (DNA/RNA ligase family)